MTTINHVAIIMDGNGRWGIRNKKNRNLGHKQGLVTLENIVKKTIRKKIKYLTLFTFSTENWKRPKKEIKYLFNLLNIFLTRKLNEFHKQNIKIKFIGTINKLDKLLVSNIRKAENLTKFNNGTQINVALNYGAKDEIINAIKLIRNKKLNFSIDNLEKNLYTKNIPDPEILIRTGNTKRLSNFLLWQLSYTEIFFEKKLWPDFTDKDYEKVLKSYKNINRNFGAVNE
jgi:undecaprenyl diphosphate synthase